MPGRAAIEEKAANNDVARSGRSVRGKGKKTALANGAAAPLALARAVATAVSAFAPALAPILVIAAAAAFASAATVTETVAAESEGPPRNPKLLALEPNRWVKIHQQSGGDAVRFRRQAHGGSCFDSKRGRLILFGCDTHGKDWINSPLVFDPVACSWSRMYTDDDFKTYKVNEEGLPVAGEKGEHPWTMHTFGAVVYDPVRDEMVVCCYDAHMKPGQFTNAMTELWPKVKRHPTWVLELETGRWKALECQAVHFFPFAAEYDADRRVVVGCSSAGIWELGGEPRQWKKVCDKGAQGWHNNMAYDSKNKVFVVFGAHMNSNDVIQYKPGGGQSAYRIMPTPGIRPPKDQHNPMAFDPESGRTVVLVDRIPERTGDGASAQEARTETWLYDAAADAWTRLEGADLPFPCGMNYNMEYDPGHKVMLLATGDYKRPTTVWALKIRLGDPQRAGN